jgi:hypothetical protein
MFRLMAKPRPKARKPPQKKNPHAVALGRRGGRAGGTKGGKARWATVPAEERFVILRRAVQARWAKAKRKKTSRTD